MMEQSVATLLMLVNSVMWGRVIATFCEVRALIRNTSLFISL